METNIKQDKVIVICAPSGSGKTSIYNQLLIDIPVLAKSISAATRKPRGSEVSGVDYYFMSLANFESKKDNNEFVEWERVYEGKLYGTLKSEIARINALGKIPILDIDVKGAQSIKEIYGDNALIIFIKAPIENIKERLEKRGTDSAEDIQTRLDRLPEELTYEGKSDVVVENIVLADAQKESKQVIEKFIGIAA